MYGSIVFTHRPAFASLLAVPFTLANRADIADRLLDGFPGQQTTIAALLDLAMGQPPAGPPPPPETAADALYWDALAATAPPEPIRIRHIGPEFDFFHAERDGLDWRLPRCVNFLARAGMASHHRIALVTSVRNEGINLLEWIAHHRLLGIDDFFIYANDNDDGSTALLTALAEQGIIHVIWNRTALTPPGSMFPIQAKAFGHACEFNPEISRYAWLFFADADEFLVTRPMLETPEAMRPIDDLLDRLEAGPRPAAAIAMHWKWFTSNSVFRRRPGLNFARFQHYVPFDHVKTIVRNGSCLSFSTSHFPRLPYGDIVLDGALQPAATPGHKMPTVYGYAQINHYWNKSFEEFISRHLRVRGNRSFADFFDFGNNRRNGIFEPAPVLWQTRLQHEISRLQNLPGIAAAVADIETIFAERLQDFDREHDSEKLFYRYFVKEINP